MKEKDSSRRKESLSHTYVAKVALDLNLIGGKIGCYDSRVESPEARSGTSASQIYFSVADVTGRHNLPTL
mgnify:CR=1 FL=1